MKLIPLETWVEQTYSEHWRPSVVTVRHWIKHGRISPAPEKHGKRLMFQPNAKYVEPTRIRISRGSRKIAA